MKFSLFYLLPVSYYVKFHMQYYFMPTFPPFVFAGVKSAFRKVKESYSLGEPYDYASIMHYPWTAFTKNGKATMEPLKKVTIQPYQHISQGDSRQISRMYSCRKLKPFRLHTFYYLKLNKLGDDNFVA